MFRLLVTLLLTFSALYASNSCVKCHEGIEEIRDPDSAMMKEIYKVAEKAGYPDNDCIVCHGGDPMTMIEERAHQGTVEYFLNHEGPKEYYPAPGSPWINQNTCGMCHKEQVSAQMNSLMMTEQGKIQGAMWGFGAKEGYDHSLGTYKSKNPEDPHKRLGSNAYKAYMQALSKLEPQAFPAQVTDLPEAPTAEEVEKDPSLAVYTYLRQECLRCHTGGKGRQKRGDYRGLGCAACHIPYSNAGLYEGGDQKISKEPGHLLVHTIQSSRKAKVKVHGVEYSGVPVETCSTCHNRGKRIGVSYQGLMETEYHATFDEEGKGQPELHSKRYLHMQEDIHYQKGMLCQDCHTSNDMHGDGFLSGTNLGAVEIECQDCHGTTSKYPWELPIGYSDEFNETAKAGEPRGTTKLVAEYLKQGAVADAPEGYLLTARGNPITKAVRKGDKVLMHLASGKDIELTPLKKLKKDKKLSREALTAMDQIQAHTDELECYTCHATWAPQHFGSHVKIDYSERKKNPDFLAASHDQDIHGTTGGMHSLKKYLIDGKVTETSSFLRWEDPALSQNGEGRIAPTIPGCQTTVTVIGKEGKALLQNHIFKIPNAEGAGEEGQNAIDMAAVQPHTISKSSRSCESCHASAKAVGLGIGGGKFSGDQSRDTVIDLMTADGRILPREAEIQIPGIANLKNGYSRFIDENGTQLQTVGHHWKLSQPLNAEQRSSCHQEMPDNDLAVSVIAHTTEMAGIDIDKKRHGFILNKLLLIGAWLQLLVGILIGGYIIYRLFFKRKKPRRWR